MLSSRSELLIPSILESPTSLPFTPNVSQSKLFSGYGGETMELPQAPVKTLAVQVAVRIRPFVEKELQEMTGKKKTQCVKMLDRGISMLDGRRYFFDYVYGPEEQQAEVYSSSTLPLLNCFLDGFNATILAYGQTGSGKTYTMGTDATDLASSVFESLGILPRIVTDLYASTSKASDPNTTYLIRCQFLEIYQEEIRDLLADKQVGCALRESNGRVIVTGAKEHAAPNYEAMMKIFFRGCSMRTSGATLMNQRSSRSHAIFTIILRKTVKGSAGAVATTTSKFNLVDLAGSERNKKTGAQGVRFKEAVHINKGLLALGNVISALGDPRKKGSHVPYRQSRITRLLQDALGGNSRTLMIACCSPAVSNMDETLNTLKYANRARNIQNTPTNVVALSPSEITALQQALIMQVHVTLKTGAPDQEPAELITKLDADSLWDAMVLVAHGMQKAQGAIPPPPARELLKTASILTNSHTVYDDAPIDDQSSELSSPGVSGHGGSSRGVATPRAAKYQQHAMAESMAALREEHATLFECIRNSSIALMAVQQTLEGDVGTSDIAVRSAASCLASIRSSLDSLVDSTDHNAHSDASSDMSVLSEICEDDLPSTTSTDFASLMRPTPTDHTPAISPVATSFFVADPSPIIPVTPDSHPPSPPSMAPYRPPTLPPLAVSLHQKLPSYTDPVCTRPELKRVSMPDPLVTALPGGHSNNDEGVLPVSPVQIIHSQTLPTSWDGVNLGPQMDSSDEQGVKEKKGGKWRIASSFKRGMSAALGKIKAGSKIPDRSTSQSTAPSASRFHIRSPRDMFSPTSRQSSKSTLPTPS